MTGREAALRWSDGRRHLREWISHYIPATLTYYPWEIFAAVLGLLIGGTLLLGIAAPTSLALLLPLAVYWAYATALFVGGATVAYGLRRKSSPVIASGLQLLGGSYGVYAVATVAISGWAVAFLVFAAFGLVCVVCLVRAHHFRRLTDIQSSIARRESP